jgi:hypothetical protein
MSSATQAGPSGPKRARPSVTEPVKAAYSGDAIIPRIGKRRDSQSSSSSEESEESDDSGITDTPSVRAALEAVAALQIKGKKKRKAAMSKLYFTGNRPGQLEEFLTKCKSEFKLDAALKDDEEAQAAFIITKLGGPAYKWFEHTKKGKPDIETDASELMAELNKRYGMSDEEKQQNAQVRIGTISQKGSVHAYTTYYDSTATEAGWKEDTPGMKTQYLNGLMPHIQRAIRMHPDFGPDKSRDWIEQYALKLENASRATKASQPQPTVGKGKTLQCYKCGKFGHKKADCRSQGQSGQTNQQPYIKKEPTW